MGNVASRVFKKLSGDLGFDPTNIEKVIEIIKLNILTNDLIENVASRCSEGFPMICSVDLVFVQS